MTRLSFLSHLVSCQSDSNPKHDGKYQIHTKTHKCHPGFSSSDLTSRCPDTTERSIQQNPANIRTSQTEHLFLLSLEVKHLQLSVTDPVAYISPVSAEAAHRKMCVRQREREEGRGLITGSVSGFRRGLV